MLSFKTAKRLKKAGFQQPDLELGQIWYDDFGGPRVSIREQKSGDWLVFNGALYFAPTATDILKQLPEGILLHRNHNDGFTVSEPLWGETGLQAESHPNADEACALAWLQLNNNA